MNLVSQVKNKVMQIVRKGIIIKMYIVISVNYCEKRKRNELDNYIQINLSLTIIPMNRFREILNLSSVMQKNEVTK